MTTKELMEQRKKIYDSIHDMREALNKDADGKALDKARDFTAEERAAYEKASEDFQGFTRQIADAQKEEEMRKEVESVQEKKENTPGRETRTKADASAGTGKDVVTAAEFRTALNGWARSGRGITSVDEAEAMSRLGIVPGGELSIRLNRKAPRTLAEARAMDSSTATEGSEFIPQEFRNELEEALLEYGDLREYVTVMRTATGAALPMPTMNDTGNKGSQIAEDTDNSADETLPTTGSTTLNAFKFTSNPVLVTQELLEDGAFDMASIITSALGMRLARIQNEKITTGSGSSTPNGIVTAATAGRTATSVTAISYTDLLLLLYSVGGAYRRNGRFVMNDAIIPSLRLIKDDAGQYIFRPSLEIASGETILGKQIVFNNEMASSIAASAITVLFGDLSKYMIREVNTVRVYRLVERYRLENDADAFVAYMRFDGDLLDAGTHPVKKLTQASGS